jgi:hypothetical protein
MPLLQMPDRRISALNFAASSTQEELEVLTVAYAGVIDHLHRCAWDVFSVERQAAKLVGGTQQIVERVSRSQVVRLHAYQFASTQNDRFLRLDFNLQYLHFFMN